MNPLWEELNVWAINPNKRKRAWRGNCFKQSENDHQWVTLLHIQFYIIDHRSANRMDVNSTPIILYFNLVHHNFSAKRKVFGVMHMCLNICRNKCVFLQDLLCVILSQLTLCIHIVFVINWQIVLLTKVHPNPQQSLQLIRFWLDLQYI